MIKIEGQTIAWPGKHESIHVGRNAVNYNYSVMMSVSLKLWKPESMLRWRSTFCLIKVNTEVLEPGFATAGLTNVVKPA